jgi:hypothetical protein
MTPPISRTKYGSPVMRCHTSGPTPAARTLVVQGAGHSVLPAGGPRRQRHGPAPACRGCSRARARRPPRARRRAALGRAARSSAHASSRGRGNGRRAAPRRDVETVEIADFGGAVHPSERDNLLAGGDCRDGVPAEVDRSTRPPAHRGHPAPSSARRCRPRPRRQRRPESGPARLRSSAFAMSASGDPCPHRMRWRRRRSTRSRRRSAAEQPVTRADRGPSL